MNPLPTIALTALAIFSANANTLTEITALGTPSQTHNHGSGLYPPENAIDGDLTTFNHTESQTPGAAWELHFPAEHEISSVEIVSRDCCAGRLNGAKLRLFDDDAEMVFEIAIADAGPLTTFTATMPAGTVAKDIRIGFEPGQTGIVHIAEARVFSPAGDPPSINSFNAQNNTTLNWDVAGADTVEIHGIGSVPSAGSMDVSPAESTAYILSATNVCDTVTASAAIIVAGAPLLPRITEFSAFPDDWVEIWNPGDSPIDLGGWHLTDDPGDFERWSFPAGQSLAPGGFLIVESPFGLAREADSYLALIDPSGAIVSEFTYPEQFEGPSYGTDLDGNAVYLIEPSPGTFNGGPTTLGFLKGVDFSVGRRLYSVPLSLTLTPMTPGATVLYSLGGADPTIEYTTPIQITTTTVVRAIEVREGSEPSRSEAHTYLYFNDVPSQPEFPAGLQDDWLPASASGALAPIPRRSDYEMDPEIVASAPFPARVGGPFDVSDALRDIPSMCLTLPAEQMWDPDDGLHANALKRGRAWEREISMEVIDPAHSNVVHFNCGLRIHGGRGRVAEMLKKSFRLYFRGDYGATKFDFPLFKGIPTRGVDHLVLRGGNGKTWASPWRALTGGGNSLPRVTYLRDQFLRDTQRAMGQPAYSGTFVHLYINGIYWGLYNPVERPGGNYAANHFGGDEDEYDVVKWANALPPQIVNGDLNAWNQLVALTRNDPAANWGEILSLLDVDNLADYLIANFYVGNIDWVRNNAYAFRPRPEVGDGRYRFTCWDGEESLLSITRNSTTDGRDNNDTPLELHNNLRAAVPEYRLMFADRIHRHLVDEDGVLLSVPATARHDALADQIDRAITAESARWGDLLRPNEPYTHGDWLTEIANITSNYLTARPGIAFNQMKADDLYPDTGAPIATILGGAQVKLSSPSGAIWFTVDGSDPRTSPNAQLYDPSSNEVEIVASADWSYLDNGSDLSSTEWTSAGFDDSAWSKGQAPLGYGTISGATLKTIVGFGPDQFDKHITTYFRHQFQIADTAELGSIELRYLRDDGIVIYLNGVEIERSNLPGGATDSSTLALSSIAGSEEGVLHTAIVPDDLLQTGDNLLAVELHQEAANSSDLGFDLSLVARNDGITLGGDTQIKARALDDGEWSALEDEYFRVLDPVGNIVVSEIMYHPAGPASDEIAAGHDSDDDFEFIEIRNIGGGAILLDGMRFTKGVDATLSGFIGPGAYALIVADRVAFEMRYGRGLPIVGEWQSGDHLDNSGERIRLLDASNNPVLDFRYSDRDAWPVSADGAGDSLVLIAPASGPDPGTASNWRPSANANGSPGSSDSTTFQGGDSKAFLNYATGNTFPLKFLPSGKLAFTLEINPLADDVIGTVEISTDLRTWQPGESLLERTDFSRVIGGFSRVTYTSLSVPAHERWHIRYRVTLRE